MQRHYPGASRHDPETALSLLEIKRRIPIDVSSRYGVKEMNGKLTFEFIKNGELRYNKHRIEKPGGGKSFFRDNNGVESCFWNADCLLDEPGKDDVLIITEGEIDALSVLTAGYPFVVSCPDGAPSRPGEGDIDPSTDNKFKFLWEGKKLDKLVARHRKVILCTDNDGPGLVLRDELAIRIGRNKCWYVTYPDKSCKDANDVLVQHGQDGVRKLIDQAKPIVPPSLVPLSEVPVAGYQTRLKADAWGMFSLHCKICPPELAVVTGSPGSGKSLWTLALAAEIARSTCVKNSSGAMVGGIRTAVLQFEDNIERVRDQLTKFAINNVPGAGDKHDEDGVVLLGDPEIASKWIDEHFRVICPPEDDKPEADYTLAWLADTIEEAATVHSCKMVIIDPWNEIEHVWERSHSEAQYTNDALRALKKLARRFQIAIFVVTHPSKSGGQIKEIEETSLYDVAGAAAWKNKADHGFIVQRGEGDATIVKIDKSKNHDVMGQPGICDFMYSAATGTYRFVKSRVPERKPTDLSAAA